MKKKLFMAAVLLAAASFVMPSCKKAQEAVDCSKIATTYSTAAQAYLTAQTDANCIALKTAINTMISSSCTQVTAEMKTAAQAQLAALPCK